MALVKCRECSHIVSSEANACPECGAKPKQPMGRLQVIVLLIFGGFVISKIMPSDRPPDSTPVPVVAAPTPAETAAKAAADQRFMATAKVLATIKAAMRDPESLKWDRILSNEDGTVVCVTYRGRNGFGGMNFEHVAYAGGSLSTSKEAWNKNCVEKSLYEMRHAQYALK